MWPRTGRATPPAASCGDATAARLSAQQCLRLAALLAAGGDEAAAAAEYERAFKDPALDAVMMSNSSRWLVEYYERNRQLDRALDLAERSAHVGSRPGLTTLARLYERRGRLDEARLLVRRDCRPLFQQPSSLASTIGRR